MPDEEQNKKPIDPLELKAVELGREIAKSYMANAIESWERTDKFSTWALAAAGAGVAVGLSHLSQMLEKVGRGATHALLWSLAISVLAGIAQKYFGLYASNMAAMSEAQKKIEADLPMNEWKAIFSKAPAERSASHYKTALYSALAEVRPAIPWVIRSSAIRRALRDQGDPNSGLRRGFGAMLWQLLLTAVQLVALGVAAVIAAAAA